MGNAKIIALAGRTAENPRTTKALKVLLQDYIRRSLLLDIAKEALEFYGDPTTYWAIAFLPDPPCGEFMEDFAEPADEWWDNGWSPSPGVARPGKRARDALVRINKLEGSDA